MIATALSLLAAALAVAAEAPAPAAPVAAPAIALAPIVADQAKVYEDSLKAAIQSAEAEQGPLDGGWMLAGGGGQPLYRFEFADRGVGLGLAEGSWRDLRVIPAALGSGFITSIAADGTRLMLRFYEADANDLVVVTVRPAGAAWTGELWRKGAVTAVTLLRE